MSKSLGNGVDLGEQLDGVRRGRGAADPGLRRPARGRHRLGRHVARRVAAVPAARLAADRRRDLARPGADPAAGDVALRKVTHRTRARGRRSWSRRHRFNVMVARMMELVNATRKAIDSGCGAGRPGRARGRRGGGDPAVAGRAVHRRGDVGAAGPPADGRPRRLAGGRRGAAGRGLRDRRRAGAGQGAGPAGGRRPTSPTPTWRRWRWPTRPSSARSTGATVRKVIVRAPKLVNIVVGLTRR